MNSDIFFCYQQVTKTYGQPTRRINLQYLRESHDLWQERRPPVYQLCEAQGLYQLGAASVGEILPKIGFRIKDCQREVQIEELEKFPANMTKKLKTELIDTVVEADKKLTFYR